MAAAYLITSCFFPPKTRAQSDRQVLVIASWGILLLRYPWVTLFLTPCGKFLYAAFFRAFRGGAGGADMAPWTRPRGKEYDHPINS